MKWSIVLMFAICANSVWAAQDASSLIKLAEDKTYTPRAKNLKDIVVDIVSPQLTKRLNDQLIFGKIDEAIFRVYWTAEPERIAMEVVGLPDGFKEIKEELKISMISHFEKVVPVPIAKRFQAYTFKNDDKSPRVINAIDSSHQLLIPEFEMTFASTGVLEKLVAKKPVGTITTSFSYEKESWSDPRYVVVAAKTESVEGPQRIDISTEIAHLVTAGMGLPSVVKTVTKLSLKPLAPGSNPVESTNLETIFFKDYKVNTGSATKWFLAQSTSGDGK